MNTREFNILLVHTILSWVWNTTQLQYHESAIQIQCLKTATQLYIIQLHHEFCRWQGFNKFKWEELLVWKTSMSLFYTKHKVRGLLFTSCTAWGRVIFILCTLTTQTNSFISRPKFTVHSIFEGTVLKT